jgi:hypothetical protein
MELQSSLVTEAIHFRVEGIYCTVASHINHSVSKSSLFNQIAAKQVSSSGKVADMYLAGARSECRLGHFTALTEILRASAVPPGTFRDNHLK